MKKINCKEKRTVGKANRNKCRKNTIGLKKLKIKIIQKRKKGRKAKGKKEKKENSTEHICPMQRQRFITTLKSVTKYAHILHIHP